MKKKLPRIMACLMACVLAFNMVAVPKARAVGPEVVGTAALATSSLAAYMTATGVPLTVITGGSGAASAGAASLISGYAAATGGTYSVVTTAIASGVTIGTGGVILISAAAAALLAGIVAWAIDHYSLEEFDIPQSLDYSTHGVFLADGTPVATPFFDYEYGVDIAPSMQLGATAFDCSKSYTFESGYTFSKAYFEDNYGSQDAYQVDVFGPGGDYLTHIVLRAASILPNGDDFPEYYYFATDSYSLPDKGYAANVFSVDLDERYVHHGQGIYFLDAFGVTGTTYETEVSKSPDYKPMPELNGDEVIQIEPDLSPSIEPEAVPDAIFEKIANDEFEPTYKVTVPAGDSDSDPDPNPDPNPNPDGDGGSDSDTGLDTSESIGWLKRIALACEALADKILGGIETIFAPDPALMQEISEAFTEKFGFVSPLYDLGSDLLSISADSSPPVVYIHLEDAEGSIDYGGTVKALDMSWYSRYKPDVDRIMSGFLWIGFLWLLFKRASAIINGAEMATDYGTDIHDGFRIRGERNGKRF